MADDFARYGWDSDFPEFRDEKPREIRERLHRFVPDASPEQIRAWDDSIPHLQSEVSEILQVSDLATRYEAIL